MRTTRAEREGKRPEGYAKLKWAQDYGYWVWIKGDGTRYRATDLSWPNEARYPYDRRPGEPKEDPTYEPYPIQFLAKALGCSNTDVLGIIGRYGQFYRRRNEVTKYRANADITVNGNLISAGNTFVATPQEAQGFIVNGQAEPVSTEAKKTEKPKAQRRR